MHEIASRGKDVATGGRKKSEDVKDNLFEHFESHQAESFDLVLSGPNQVGETAAYPLSDKKLPHSDGDTRVRRFPYQILTALRIVLGKKKSKSIE